MRRDTDPWGQVDAIALVLESIDWSALKFEPTSPAGDKFLIDGVSPKRLKLHVCVTVEVDPSPSRGKPARKPLTPEKLLVRLAAGKI